MRAGAPQKNPVQGPGFAMIIHADQDANSNAFMQAYKPILQTYLE